MTYYPRHPQSHNDGRNNAVRPRRVAVPSSSPSTEHLDVLIVGAGISGIGAAYYLQDRSPSKSFAIVEARDALGGTWDLFRYPGIRSDSDLHTFGYEFRPWREKEAIAPGSSILRYLNDTAKEFGIDEHIRFNHRVIGADWSTDDSFWTVHLDRTDTDERFDITADWIFSASGYYNYEEGYAPEFPGADRFRGPIIHPQAWPEDLDYAGKRVVVIGSGATAITIVPAIAESADHVTMLQRTPSYILPTPAIDPYADRVRGRVGMERAHPIVRRRNIRKQALIWQLCRRFPTLMRRFIRWANVKSLPEGYPVDEHFNPPYRPWDQRMCFAPDGDFFTAIRSGKASMVTDRVRAFTETGIELESGQTIDADVIVTATGLNLLTFGGIDITVDGASVDLSEKVSYRGMMLDGVPNLAYSIGYTNSSWTLKVGLLCEYFTRLLNYMDESSFAVCYPERPEGNFPTRPLLDFGAGYIQRSLDTLPKQGPSSPWLTSMKYQDDVRLLRKAPVTDRFLRFRKAEKASRPKTVSTAA
jgi:monooxygenase